MKVASKGELKGPKNGSVTPEQMELSRLKEELIPTQRELEIIKKAAAYFAKGALEKLPLWLKKRIDELLPISGWKPEEA